MGVQKPGSQNPEYGQITQKKSAPHKIKNAKNCKMPIGVMWTPTYTSSASVEKNCCKTCIQNSTTKNCFGLKVHSGLYLSKIKTLLSNKKCWNTIIPL